MGDFGSATSTVTFGKRKRHQNYSLQLSTESDLDSSSGYLSSDCQSAVETSTRAHNMPLIIANGKLVIDNAKRYRCTLDGCIKSYRKPSRLEEHERSHTGERPFGCMACGKTYLRETHLQAHVRTHQPASARLFTCHREDCNKRFWTAQHLKRHEELHSGLCLYKCAEGECTEAFAKHHQLRAHVATHHCLPGTKPFRCVIAECTKSFLTNQKLRTHMRTHEERRYFCCHHNCTLDSGESTHYFATWSALRSHTRSAHPPTCPYTSCNGKTFTAQKGLRVHMKLHEQQEVERVILEDANDDTADDEDEMGRPKKRRRGGEVGRDWACEEEGCEKDFKSKKSRDTHFKIFHLRRRDFICSVDGCGQSFGYKHLLQRHMARLHTDSPLVKADAGPPLSSAKTVRARVIDVLTGKAYKDRISISNLGSARKLICPYPHMSFIEADSFATLFNSNLRELPVETESGRDAKCTFAFSRAYDLRRHLLSEHGLAVEKDPVDRLVARLRFAKKRGERETADAELRVSAGVDIST